MSIYSLFRKKPVSSEGNGNGSEEVTAKDNISLYEKYGGEGTIKALVDSFYESMLSDPALAPVFEATDLGRLKRHQALFISQALGGPKQYEGRDMASAHEGLAITGEQFERVGGHLQKAMEGLGVEPEDVSTIMGIVASLKDDIVSAAEPEQNLDGKPGVDPTVISAEESHFERWLRGG